MYINSKQIIRKFEAELTDGSETIKIHVLPPKLSLFEKLSEIETAAELSTMKSLLLEILNRNEENTEITEKFFENAVDIISFNALFTDIVDWINNAAKK